MGLDDTGERVNVIGRPRNHNEQAHLRRYEWAAALVSGDVLDAACGLGYGTGLLAEAGCTVTGVDTSGEVVRYAQSRFLGLTFRVATLPDLPFADASFDAVVSFETIEHIEDDRAALISFRRVLRPGGTLVISTPNRARTQSWLKSDFHVREYTKDELTELIRSAGFDAPDGYFSQDSHATGRLHAAARILLNRVHRLVQPDRWWDVLAYGNAKPVPFEDGDFFLLAVTHRNELWSTASG